MGDLKIYPRKSKSPLRAIRLFCFECMGMDRRVKNAPRPFTEVEECTDTACPLYDFRFGKNPFLPKGKGNPKAVEALKKWREKKRKEIKEK